LTNEFEKFFELSFDMLALLDLEGKFKNINRTFSQNLGWTLEDFDGISFWDLVIPTAELSYAHITQNLSNGHPLIFIDSQVKSQDGSLHSLRWTAYPDLDDQRIYLIIREETAKSTEQDVFKQALESSPTGVLIVANGKIRFCNYIAEILFGYSQADLIGKPIEMLVPIQLRSTHGKLRKQYEHHPYLRLMGTDIELSGQRKDGSKFPLDIGLNPVQTIDGLVVVCSIIDISRGKATKITYAKKIRQLEKEISVLDKLSLTDELTSVNNRRALFKQLELHYRIAQKENQPISFVLIDIDNFKSYNDTFGHPAGDTILRTIAEIMTKSVRRTEIVARYGGEEFGMILPSTDVNEAKSLTERLRKMIEEHAWPLREITISAGTATVFPKSSQAIDPDGISNFIIMVDQALYYSKRTGKNRVTHFDDMPINQQENLSDWKIHHETPADN